jgi:CDP-glycerol glycerophosphotransferase (TagB/SpsB family)
LYSTAFFIPPQYGTIQLPLLYPDVNFVFRPHPLLLTTLCENEFWGKQKTNDYLLKLKSFSNVAYSDSGSYFDLFANSDAIIHDCGSFLAEYLLTEHPACYMLRNVEQIEEMLGDTGKKCLKNCYQAFAENDILNFIDNVVINGNDTMKNERIRFVNEELKINYPNVGKFILEYLEGSLRS